MKSILVVDDEADIVDLISYNLTKEGFSVDTSFDGEAAIKKLQKGAYDLIILDLMLPGVQGLELCKMVRNNPAVSHIPVIMLTAKGEEIDKILGLEMGADDYMTKPFSPRELVARTKAILRRTDQQRPAAGGHPKEASNLLKIKDLIIDRDKYTVAVADRQVKLSATEFKLLLYLSERPNKIFNRDRLLDAIWDSEVFVEPRTVDVHIRRLRQKIEINPDDPRYIKTMRGVGYYIDAE